MDSTELREYVQLALAAYVYFGLLNGAGARKVAADAWQTDDRRINYTLATDGTRTDLVITFSDRTDTITLRNWSPDRNLGITLDEVIAPAVTTTTFTGDYAKATNPEGTSYQTTANGYASAGPSANAADVINGDADAELLQGLGGNDGIAGAWSQDTIVDADGVGVIQVEGLGTLSGGGTRRVADNVWQIEDKRLRYTPGTVNARSHDEGNDFAWSTVDGDAFFEDTRNGRMRCGPRVPGSVLSAWSNGGHRCSTSRSAHAATDNLVPSLQEAS